MRIQQALAACRLDVKMAPTPLPELERRLRQVPAEQRLAQIAMRRVNGEVWTKHRIVDARVGDGEERTELGVRDDAVEIRVGRAPQSRAQLVAEHAALIAFPLVALPIRGGREHETGICELGGDLCEARRAVRAA